MSEIDGRRHGGSTFAPGPFNCARMMARMLGTSQVEESETGKKRNLSRKLDAIGWGMFFIWVGLVLLVEVQLGVALLGVGVITLAGQAARWSFNLKLEGFWCVVGIGFVLGGIWNLAEVEISPFPIMLIAAGSALLLSTVFPWRRRAR